MGAGGAFSREEFETSVDDFFERCFPPEMWLPDTGDMAGEDLSSELPIISAADSPLELFACKLEVPQSTSASGGSEPETIKHCSQSAQDSSRSHSGANSELVSAAATVYPLHASSGGSGNALAASGTSIISWGPPRQLEAAAPPPHPTNPADPDAWTPADNQPSLNAASTTQAPGATFRPGDNQQGSSSSYLLDSLFLPQLAPQRPSPFVLSSAQGQGSGSMTQLLFSDAAMEQGLHKSKSLAGLSSKSSGVAVAAANGQGTNGKGRRSKSIPARVMSGVVKDTTRRKNAEITRLQLELEQKLSLATNLEKENQELQQRERLLKLQVSTGERRLFCESVDGITPHVQSLIQSFRSSYNQMIGGSLLAQMPKDPKKFTIKEFMMTWQSLTHEMAETLMEEASEARQQRLSETSERIANWCMSICINAVDVVLYALNTNMQTGEEYTPTMEFWSGVVDKLGLSEQQVTDLRTVYNLYSSLLTRVNQEYNELLQELTNLMEQNLHQGNVLVKLSACFMEVEALEQREAIFKKLRVGSRDCNMPHSMLSFVVLSLLDPEQQGLMVFNSFPAFPNLKMLLVAACQSAPAPK